ncbi:MAG: TlpA family protein disulfide reductase [Flavobacteriales bacterium]
MNSIKKFAPWTIRILISMVFFLSAIAKLYPNPSYALTYFEVHQLEPMGIPLNVAQYLSRILIGVEFAIGFLLLLPFFLKRVVIPITIFMLTVFIVELGIEIIFKGNAGNCGCFGTLIEMTPLEAMLKNILSIGLLIWYYGLTKVTPSAESLMDEPAQSTGKEELFGSMQAKFNWSVIGNLLLASIFGVFIAGPIRFQQAQPAKPVSVVDTVAIEPSHTHDTSLVANPQLVKKDSLEPVVDLGPKAKLSGFENIFPDINKDKKIVCFFAPGCDHCRATAKALTNLKSTMKAFPAMRIVFMDEEPEVIPDFFKFAGAEYPYYVMDIVSFWKKLGSGKEVPGVLYLWNGNTKKFYQGIDKEQFNASEFKKILNKKS